MRVKLVPLAERRLSRALAAPKVAHPHEGMPFHQKGRDLPTQYHGGPVQVRNVDDKKIDPHGRGSAYGRGFYTTNSLSVAKRRIDTKNAWNKRSDKGEVTVKKAHPDANILVAGEKEENSHPSLVKAVKEFSPKYAKVGDMGMGDMTWKHQVNKFADHHKYDAVRFNFNHPEGYPEHGNHTTVWKNHGSDKLIHVNSRTARKKGFVEGVNWLNALGDDSVLEGQNGDWSKEGYTLHHEETNPHDPDWHMTSVVAKKGGSKVGHVTFLHNSKGLEPVEVNVQPEHRRKGLASAMYDHARKVTGKSVMNIPDEQTKDGKAFRTAYNNKSTGRSRIVKRPQSIAAHQ